MRLIRWTLVWAGLALVACDDGGGGGSGGRDAGGDLCDQPSSSYTLDQRSELPQNAPAGSTVSVEARITTVCGAPAGAPEVEVSAGRVRSVPLEEGWTRFEWTLAPVPVPQRMRMTFGPAQRDFEVRATPGDLRASAEFGRVSVFLDAQGVDGTTEDLAIGTDALYLPAPGGLVVLDPTGAATWRPIDALQAPLGIALTRDQHLWIVDSEIPALLEVAPDDTVTTHLDGDAPGMLDGPNHLAIGPDGKVYLSDPCAGRILRYDPQARAIDAEIAFDVATQGGPNGVAFGPDEQLYTVTENTVVLCGHAGIAAPDAPLAHVFQIPVTPEGFGELTLLTEPVGTFGDGLAFDQDGHLYFIADIIEGLRLVDSSVYVLPRGSAIPTAIATAPQGIIYANVAFGLADFREQRLYISLLSVPPFAGAESRGVHALDVGVQRGPVWQ